MRHEMGWWEERSLPQKIAMGIGFGVLGVGLLALYGWVVMALWNWLMPEFFGLKRMDYWQAWGMLALCTLLFQGWGRSHGDHGRHDRKRKRQLRSYLENEPTNDKPGEPDGHKN